MERFKWELVLNKLMSGGDNVRWWCPPARRQFPSPVRRPQFGQNILLTQIHIKKARDPEFHRSSRTQGSRIAFQPRISNAEAHAVCILTWINNITNGHWSIALPCGWIIEFARFSVPQIRRWLNAFYICLLPAFRPFGLRNEQRGKFTIKFQYGKGKLQLFSDCQFNE